MDYLEKDLVYYERTGDVVNCYLNLDSEERFNVYASVNNCDYVKIGDELLHLSNHSYLEKYKIVIPIFASDEGYFMNRSSCIDKIHSGYHLYTIYKSADVFQDVVFPSEFVTGNDSFTQKPFIKATSYGGNKDGFHFGGMALRFEFINNKHTLNVLFSTEYIQFTNKCTLHLLLEDGSILNFSDFKKPVKCFDKKHKITSTTLNTRDIEFLSCKKVIKWQLINDEGVVLEESFFPARKSHLTDFRRKVFQDYFIKYLSLYNDIKIGAEEDSKVEEITNSSCFVYLMVDTTNNFHKIGISNKPQYREHTLQSDKPTIELLCAKEYPTRIIAEAIESALHKAFASKRIRGEWFNLDVSEIEDIKKTLK